MEEGGIRLLADAPNWAMEFVHPTVSFAFLDQWPDAAGMAAVMGALYWHQLAMIIEGTDEPNSSVLHNINVIATAITRWEDQRDALEALLS